MGFGSSDPPKKFPAGLSRERQHAERRLRRLVHQPARGGLGSLRLDLESKGALWPWWGGEGEELFRVSSLGRRNPKDDKHLAQRIVHIKVRRMRMLESQEASSRFLLSERVFAYGLHVFSEDHDFVAESATESFRANVLALRDPPRSGPAQRRGNPNYRCEGAVRVQGFERRRGIIFLWGSCCITHRPKVRGKARKTSRAGVPHRGEMAGLHVGAGRGGEGFWVGVPA